MDEFYNNDFISMSEQRKKEKRKLRSSYNKVCLAIILNLIVSLCVGLFYGIIAQIISLPMDGIVLDIVDFCSYGLSMLIPAWVIYLLYKRTAIFPSLSVIRGREFFPGLALSFGATFLGSVATNIVAIFGSSWGLQFTQPDFTAPKGGLEFFIYFLQMTIGAGLFEELLFRGAVLGALRRYGDKTAIVVSALLFGIVHANLVQMPFAFVLGIYYGYMVCKTGSLLYPIIFHSVNNAISCLITSAGEIGGEGLLETLSGFYVLSCIVLGAVGLIIELTRRRRGTTPHLLPEKGVLSVFEKVWQLVASPSFWALIIFYGIFAIQYISVVSIDG